MSFSDEILAAYVDGELDAAAGADIERAARSDPSVAERIARYRGLRERLQAVYAPVLDEPVPERLHAALRGGESQRRRSGSRRTAAARWRYSLAAGVLLAVGAGLLLWQQRGASDIEKVDGTLVARGGLADGLSNQLAGDAGAGSAVRIGLSFRGKSGDYCRTFSLSEDAGLACRRAGRWEIVALAPQPAAQASGDRFRTASSALPAVVLQAVEQRIAAEPLDRDGELEARGKHWSGAPPP
jgi:hypothetical protein